MNYHDMQCCRVVKMGQCAWQRVRPAVIDLRPQPEGVPFAARRPSAAVGVRDDLPDPLGGHRTDALHLQ